MAVKPYMVYRKDPFYVKVTQIFYAKYLRNG